MEQNEIHQMKKEMQQLNGKVDKIIDILSGNEYDKNDNGIVGDVRQLKARVAKLERWKDRVQYHKKKLLVTIKIYDDGSIEKL